MGYPRRLLKKNIPHATTGTSSVTGLGNIDQSFQAHTENTTPFTPAYHEQQAAQRQQQSDQLQGQLQAFSEAQSGNVGEQPQSTDQIKAYKAPTLGQKSAFELKSIAGSLSKGIANMTIAPLYEAGNKLGLVSDEEKADILRQVSDSDKETFGLDPHNLQHGDNMVHNAINQFAFMAPALITAPGTGGASFGLQSAGQAATAVQKMKDNGVEFNNHSDDLFILGSGLIGTALGRGSMGKLFGSLGSATKNNIVTGLTADVIKELGEKGTQATADDITQAFLAKAGTLADKVGQTGLAGLQQYAKVGTELSAANAATFGTKKLANAVSGNEPFTDTTGQDFVQGVAEPFGLDKDAHGNPLTAIANMATSPAGVFGAIGAGSEALGLIGNKAPIIESLQNDNSPENVSAVKQQLAQTGQSRGWNEQQIADASKGVDLLSSTVGKLPKNLSPEKMQKGVSLIMGQDELQQQLTDLQQQRSQLHPSVSEIVTPQEELIQNKIDQANDKLKSLVTGDKVTYSKGTEANGEEGQYFKTANGEKEEITPQRYELESLEREVKADANKQTEPTTENVVPETPQENVTEKVNEEPQTNIGEPSDADKIESTRTLPLEPTPGNSETLGEGNAGQEELAGESKPESISSSDAQQKEEVIPSAEEGTITEPKATDEEPIGISREETKKQREIRGLEDLPEADRVTLSDMFDEGKKAVEDKEINPTELASHIADKPRNLAPKEVNALLYDRQNIREQLDNIKTEIDKHLDTENSSPESMELLQSRQRLLENQLDTNERALRYGARQNSLALNAMKSMINADYTLAEQRARMRVAAGGELTPAMEAELEKYKAERDKAVKDLEDYQNSQKEGKVKKEVDIEKRKATKSATKESLKAERKSIVEDFRAELKKMRQSGSFNSAGKASVEFLQAAAPFMRRMLTNLVKDGIVEVKDIVAAIRDEFKDDIEGLTDRDVMDALSGKHNKKIETKNELSEQRKAIVRTLDLTTRLEDLKNREIPEKNERRQVQKNKEIASLEEQIKEEKKKISFETAEDRGKESLRKKLDRINEHIKNNDFEPPIPKNTIKPDAERITLEAKVKKAENNFDAMAERLNSHTKSKLEKILTTIQQIRRGMLLSGTKTLAKLYSFATARSVTTPMEEAVAGLNTKVPFLSRISKNSPRFSKGFNPKAEAEAISTRWSVATLKDSWIDVLKTGVGELDRLYGKQGVDKDFDLNPSALEFFGRLHGAFKNSTKRAEFFRSFQKRLEFAAKEGQDINDPNVQFATGLEAYADAKRSILMNDNILVDKGYKSLLRGLEQSDKTNKNNTGKVIAAVIKGLFPIVKIPTNYVVESLDVATFGARAIPNLIKAMSKGADSLTPKESDMVMRTLAKGQIGLALMIYAYANPDMFGGYYSGKRKETDLKPGDIKMFGVTLPHFLSHNPYFEAMQIAATMRRAVDAADKSKKKNKPNGVVTGTKNAIKGLTEQIPFTSAGEVLGSHNESVGDVVGKTTKNLIEPRLLQEAAEWTDPDTDDKHKRNPKGFQEQLESGVPGLREQVPIKKKKK
jgi:hypothetical protein